ncbi:MAG: galactose mutarotase [Acidobacteriaceae bacterium]|nr:galactose mutarotase [Acidobacteriaceae bacterium]
MKTTLWGTQPDGESIHLYELANQALRVRVTNFGARLAGVDAADRNGHITNVVLGLDSYADYRADKAFLGALCGRYANRLADGRFSIDGEDFRIPANNGRNALHGGAHGFATLAWRGEVLAPNSVEFTMLSADGDQGFPGELTAKVRYTLEDHSLRLDYTATTTRPTVLNLTNHAYFNLSGDFSRSVLDHVVRLNASRFTPTDDTSIPTGELRSVEGTPFDFRTPHTIGERIEQQDVQLVQARGYDHNYVLDSEDFAEVYEPSTGRTLHVLTTQPGVQFYSGNYIDAAEPVHYGARTGFCLETQHFPDSPNHPQFPSTVLRPGETFRSHTIFTFGAR